MRRRTIAAVVFASLLLGAAAVASNPLDANSGTVDAAGHTVALDLGHEKVDEVEFDGRSYDVVRYRNLLPWLSGYEFFRNGARVTDADEAREVARVVGWSRAAAELDVDDVEEMEELQRRAEAVESVVAPAYSAVETLRGHVETLQDNGPPLSERSYWDVATELYPQMELVDDGLQVLEDELERWTRSAGDVSEALDDVVSTYRAVEAGEEFRADDDLERVRDATETMWAFQERSATVEAALRQTSERSASTAEELEGAGAVGGWVAEPFRSIEGSLAESADEVEELRGMVERQRGNVLGFVSTVESEEASVSSGWSRRQNAGARLLASVAALLLLLSAVVTGYRYRRRVREQLA